MFRFKLRQFQLSIALLGAVSLIPCANSFSETVGDPDTSFVPTSQTSVSANKSVRLDYSYIDNILKNTVFYLGPSDRIRRVKRNKLNNGSQGITVGHTSPYLSLIHI